MGRQIVAGRPSSPTPVFPTEKRFGTLSVRYGGGWTINLVGAENKNRPKYGESNSALFGDGCCRLARSLTHAAIDAHSRRKEGEADPGFIDPPSSMGTGPSVLISEYANAATVGSSCARTSPPPCTHSLTHCCPPNSQTPAPAQGCTLASCKLQAPPRQTSTRHPIWLAPSTSKSSPHAARTRGLPFPQPLESIELPRQLTRPAALVMSQSRSKRPPSSRGRRHMSSRQTQRVPSLTNSGAARCPLLQVLLLLTARSHTHSHSSLLAPHPSRHSQGRPTTRHMLLATA